MKNKFLFPLNIQMFADDDPGTDQTNIDDQGKEGEEGGEPNNQPKTFTQEELDKIVQGRIAKERKSWEKQLEDQKTEAQKLETMSDKEKKKYQEEKRIKELDDREAAITRRELTAQAKVQLADKEFQLNLLKFLILLMRNLVKRALKQ